MSLPTTPVGQVYELGIDDFSFRRGRKFGTILVDMRSHHTIDLLPDRKAETVLAWMATHPEIELVSRDRGGDYASAAAIGAPQAVQVQTDFISSKISGRIGKDCSHVISRVSGSVRHNP